MSVKLPFKLVIGETVVRYPRRLSYDGVYVRELSEPERIRCAECDGQFEVAPGITDHRWCGKFKLAYLWLMGYAKSHYEGDRELVINGLVDWVDACANLLAKGHSGDYYKHELGMV